ncbi:hypothetical protein Tco_1462654 [Tanacetum coccineum]
MYVSPPCLAVVRPWFATIRYNGEIGAKGTLNKSCLPPRWRLLMAQIIQCLGGPPFTDHMKAICNLDVHVDSKALKPSSQTEETKASKSKIGQSEKETQSSSAKEKSPSHPSPPTPVVGEMHKEAQQGGPTSLGATSKEGAHPLLNSGCNALVDSTTEADPGTSAPNDFVPSQQDEISKKIKLEDLSKLLKDTRSAFFPLDSSQDEPIIVSDESEEEETKKDEDTYATSHDVPEDTSFPHPPSLKSAQIQELMAQVHLLQSQKKDLEQKKATAEG